MDLPNRQVPQEFNLNAFWGELSGSVGYSTSFSKCTHIQNPCVRVAQRILACCFFAWDDSLNVPRLPELYFLSYMLDGIQTDLGEFLARQLYSPAASIKDRIVIGDVVTTIARFWGVVPNPEVRDSGFERHNQAAFELMNFCKVGAGHSCRIYPRDRLLALPNVDRITSLHRGTLQLVLDNA